MVILVVVFTVDVVCLDKDGFVDTAGDSSDTRYTGSAVVAFNDIFVSMSDFVTSSPEPFRAELAGGCCLDDTPFFDLVFDTLLLVVVVTFDTLLACEASDCFAC